MTKIIATIGDSLTSGDLFYNSNLKNGLGGNYQGYLKNKLNKKWTNLDFQIENYGIPGQTTDQIYSRLSSIIHSDIVILMMGTNDCWLFGNGNQEYHSELVADIVQKFVDSIHFLYSANPLIELFIFSIPPVGRSSGMLGMKSIIQNVNMKIEKLCNNAKSVYYINLFPYLADLQGDLKPEYHVGDDVHFTDEAYKIIGDTVGEEIIKNSINKGI